MKWNVLGALMLSLCLAGPSYGYGLLDMMLGSGCGCDCCEPQCCCEKSCGCEDSCCEASCGCEYRLPTKSSVARSNAMVRDS